VAIESNKKLFNLKRLGSNSNSYSKKIIVGG